MEKVITLSKLRELNKQVGKSLDRVKKHYNIPNIVNSNNPFQVIIEEIK